MREVVYAVLCLGVIVGCLTQFPLTDVVMLACMFGAIALGHVAIAYIGGALGLTTPMPKSAGGSSERVSSHRHNGKYWYSAYRF